jgi:hypothetical protein
METAGSGLCIVFARLAIIVGWFARQLQSEHLFQSEVSLSYGLNRPRGTRPERSESPALLWRLSLGILEGLCLSTLFSEVASGKLCSAWIRLVNRTIGFPR